MVLPIIRVAALCLALLASVPADARSGTEVGQPPASLQLDKFYAKHVDAAGIPILGSWKVPDRALKIAKDVVNGLLAARADVRRELVRAGTRVVVVAPSEGIMDLPEFRGWKKPGPDDPRLTACERNEYSARIKGLTDQDFWNARVRGSGGNPVSVGAENLLAMAGTRYFGENLLVHEFSHAILRAVERADPRLHARVQSAYERARASGRWKGDYAEVTLQEYWAEGTQFWFNSNMISRLDDGTILSDADLKRYDPALHAALREVYGSRHRIRADAFYKHRARLNVPPGRKSADC